MRYSLRIPSELGPLRPLIPLALALLCTSACGQDDGATFQDAPCRFALPPGIKPGDQIRCGDLDVPERYDAPNQRRISLHVGILKSPLRSAAGATEDAVVLLSGGPGQGGIVIPNHFDRDLIILSQRGTGLSHPWLECGPEFADLGVTNYQSLEETVRARVKARTQCKARWEASRAVDLAAYNTAASTQDVNALRRVLGYKQLNLFGVSYGTLLAQHVMRKYPSTVRSALLDSVWPTQVGFVESLGGNMYNALRDVLRACEASRECNDETPNIRSQLVSMLRGYRQSPLDLPTSGLRLDADLAINQLHRMLLEGPTSAIPYFIQTLATRDTHRIDQLFPGGMPSMGMYLPAELGISEAMYASVLCSDDVQYTSEQAVRDQLEVQLDWGSAPPEVASYFSRSLGEIFATCASWPRKDAQPGQREPVISNIPTLTISGQWDPNTPSTWARQVATQQQPGYSIVFPKGGHSLTVPALYRNKPDCAGQIAAAFIAQPLQRPDDRCAK